LKENPIARWFSSWRDVGLACVVWLGTPVAVVLCYLIISPAIGGLMNALRLVISLGTDATRLEVATTFIVGCRCLQTTLEFPARKKALVATMKFGRVAIANQNLLVQHKNC
jgi:hypothetical protein